jgi:hypothetical protein
MSTPVNRRSLLAGAAAGAATVVVAVLGERSRSVASEPPAAAMPAPSKHQLAEAARRQGFHEEAKRVLAARAKQTARTVADLKTKYENPVFGPTPVWELFEKLASCIDVTDSSLYAASQSLHVRQALAAMKQRGIADPDLHLIALLHDLGKVVMLAGVPAENVLGMTGRLGEAEPGAGLDRVTFQFGHPEIVYARVKDLVPDHVAWAVRYHNVDLDDAAPFMNDRDRAYAEKYLSVFRTFDRDFKSIHWVPAVDMAEYRELAERRLPRPIPF